ncbi:PTS mannose transporter subunit IID [Clostridium gasigenes]|uniref:PTS sugar transporter subunit IIA n=1 Tax=Clostridium gasigenes TaxID=94869 RepID=UPI00143832D5|nr:PTS mannose transporter subunit IID [Clostridium gasigenes]NKF05892.1 PTS mannose transporter subunit IID [Clostridium gasigenes]QSW19378.1 PTS mannose transporter subunit IID [Clostridium gasigenes]
MKILIVGHGEYATGIKSAIKLLTGVDKDLDAINLNDDITHDKFTEIMKDYVKVNKDLIVFADISGGAPFQITSREVLVNEDSENQYVVGGVALGCILEIVMNTIVVCSSEDIRTIIENAINEIPDMASVICKKDMM